VVYGFVPEFLVRGSDQHQFEPHVHFNPHHSSTQLNNCSATEITSLRTSKPPFSRNPESSWIDLFPTVCRVRRSVARETILQPIEQVIILLQVPSRALDLDYCMLALQATMKSSGSLLPLQTQAPPDLF